MRWRLLGAMVGLTVFVLLVHDVPLVAHLRNVERDRIVTELERDAFTIAGRSELLLERLEATSSGDATRINDVLQAYSAETGGRVVITGADGLAVASSDEESVTGRNYATRPEIAEALAGRPAAGKRHSSTLGVDLLYVSVPVILGDEVNGSVRITYPASVISDRVSGRLWGIFFTALVSIVVAALAAILLTFTVTRPLSRLRHATELVASEDFATRADESSGPREVRALARSFNAMSARLGRLVERQRGFAGDASHQLRTPLTALRMRLEQADEALDTDPLSARPKLDAVVQETERLQHLVDGLLALARADARTGSPVRVAPATIVADRIEAWQALAAEASVGLAPGSMSTTAARALPGAVEQIVDNFIDNALQYSPPGSTIDVAVSDAAEGVSIRVADRGPGMTPEQCELALERFWRAPDAPSGGTGLGLAIAARLAEASGGRVSLRPREGGGLVAELLLVRGD